MLNGIILPDKGKITIKGKVGALIEVGAGFHPMLTGRENIYVNGAILGMSKREIDQKFDEIVAFAELEEFIDMPVKHYSSGMYVRLGFAIAVQIDPDVLILDEILAVGDASFRAKCFKKINELRDRSISFIFVSHSFNAIALICKTALYISKGRQAFVGDAQTVLNQYQIDLTNSGTNNIIDHINNIAHYFTLTRVYFKNKDGIPATTLITGEPVTLTSMFCATKNIKNVCFHISIKRNCGGDGVLEINNIIEKFPFDINTNNSEINLSLPYLGLKTGIYQAHLSIREGALIILSESDFSFKVKGNLNIASNLFYQPHEWHVQ
jgi:lipopolysaccharide transport system ATP-binding protein